MDTQLMEELLYQQENESLDFKREQYPFAGATNEEKSELLKDLLALANSWRQSNGYILIGVDEVRGGRGTVHRVTDHLKDNDLQQFVNTKTNRPLKFSYQVFAFEGSEIGVITVPRQDRPFFLKGDFGKLKKNVVYVRRGSSTAEADPDEIGKMGAARVAERQEPVLVIQFAEPGERKGLGTIVAIQSVLVGGFEPRRELPRGGPGLPFGTRLPSWQVLPTIALPTGGFESPFGRVNKKYREEKEAYVRATSVLRPLSFAVSNTSGVVAEDVRIEVEIIASEAVLVCDQSEYPDEPAYYETPFYRAMTAPIPRAYGIEVKTYEGYHHIVARLPKVQPGKTYWFGSRFYIGARRDTELRFDALVSADNLPIPLRVPLAVQITTSSRYLTAGDVLPPERHREGS